MNDFYKGAQRLAELGAEIRPLCRITHEPEAQTLQRLAQQNAAVLLSDAAWIARCREAGLGDVFLDTALLPQEALAEAFGQCRFVLRDRAALERLDRVAAARLPEGYMENVTLALSPEGDGERFTPQNIPLFARWIRRSQALAVRGVFLSPQGAQDVSAAAREGFSLVKKLRSDLPCVLHAFCLFGLLRPLGEGNEALEKTLRMLASLNDTSLYADFLIG